MVDSPWVPHGSMSFSIFADGRAFKDWSTGETGDMITFFGKLQRLSGNKEALKKFAEFLELDDRQRREEIVQRPAVTVSVAEVRPLTKFYELDYYLPRSTEPLTLDMHSAKDCSQTYHYATIRRGSDYEIRQVAALRTIPYRGLLAAHQRVLLRFGDFKRQPAFFVLDDQAGRLDVQPHQVPRARKGRRVMEDDGYSMFVIIKEIKRMIK
jgi:hypothetical protein